MKGWLRSMSANPEPKARKIAFTLPVKLIDALEESSKCRNISKSVLVTLALEAYYKTEKESKNHV
jgi:hypothetical protein